MPTYTLSYFIKDATKVEEGATVVALGNGWFQVSKNFEARSQDDAIKHATSTVFPFGSAGHAVDIVPLIPPKLKRKAEWKQNPFTRLKVKT